MANKKDDVQEIEGTPVEEEERGEEKKTSKFLPFGKYFLLLLVIAAQAFLAYTVVDENYAEVYSYLHSNDPEDFATYQMDELVVNPAGTNGKRYLMVEISLELANKDHIELLDNNKSKLKQDMIEVLSSRTIPQLTSREGREILRSDLIRVINTVIGVRSVRNLYFTKYVMQ